jgi:hypothetical protein
MENLHEFFISWYFILLGEIIVNGEELAPINHKPHLDEFYFLLQVTFFVTLLCISYGLSSVIFALMDNSLAPKL